MKLKNMRDKAFLKKLKPVEKNCPFCQKKFSPDYKQPEILKTYTSERKKILGKDRTGLCSKHQRQVAKEIKRARFLGLLPYTSQIK